GVAVGPAHVARAHPAHPVGAGRRGVVGHGADLAAGAAVAEGGREIGADAGAAGVAARAPVRGRAARRAGAAEADRAERAVVVHQAVDAGVRLRVAVRAHPAAVRVTLAAHGAVVRRRVAVLTHGAHVVRRQAADAGALRRVAGGVARGIVRAVGVA